jgi:hypothetical protein
MEHAVDRPRPILAVRTPDFHYGTTQGAELSISDFIAW